jgi:hypothetical protein
MTTASTPATPAPDVTSTPPRVCHYQSFMPYPSLLVVHISNVCVCIVVLSIVLEIGYR